MKRLAIYLLPLLGLHACQTLRNGPVLAEDSAEKMVSAIRAYGFECAIKAHENRGHRNTTSLWWRAGDTIVDKDSVSDVYLVKCEDDQAYLIDIPHNGSPARAVRTGKLVSDWPK